MVIDSVHEEAKAFKVGLFEELLILNEVFNLVPVVSLERLVLQLIQVSLIVLSILLIPSVGWLEKSFELAPFETVAQLEEAHGFLLHTLDAHVLQSISELE